MPTSATPSGTASRRHRPSTLTVFAAAFVAGAVAAFGINQALDRHLVQSRPQVECDPIFVALHALPQGAPVTVWDVALRDWPRAMLPTSALGPHDSFEGMVLRHPLREGQPLLAVQLMPSAAATGTAPSVQPHESFTPPTPAAAMRTTQVSQPDRDLWAADDSSDAFAAPATEAAPPARAAPSAGVPSAAPALSVATRPTSATQTAPAAEPQAAPSVPAAEPVATPAANPGPAEVAFEKPALPTAAPGSPTVAEAPASAEAAASAEAQTSAKAQPVATDSSVGVTAPNAAATAASEPGGSAPAETTRSLPTNSAVVVAPVAPLAPANPAAEPIPAKSGDEPRPVDDPTLADQPPAPTPTPTELAGAPEPVTEPTPSTDIAAPLPLVAPVPMSPSTDIERPLAAMSASRSPPKPPRPEGKNQARYATAQPGPQPQPEARHELKPDPQTEAPLGPAPEAAPQITADMTPPATPATTPQPVADMPELATPGAPAEPTVAVDALPGSDVTGPVATDSVLVPSPADTTRPGLPPQSPEPQAPPVRYLVVPERIALQADNSFMPRSEAPATAQTAPAAVYPAPEVQSLPATTAQAMPQPAPPGRNPVPPSQARPMPRPERQPAKPTSPPRNRVSRSLGDWMPGFSGNAAAPRGGAASSSTRPGQPPVSR